MARVYLLHSPAVGKFPQSWSLYRFGTGPGRCEGQGFETTEEAEEFAKKIGHEIVYAEKTMGRDICQACGRDIGHERGCPRKGA